MVQRSPSRAHLVAFCRSILRKVSGQAILSPSRDILGRASVVPGLLTGRFTSASERMPFFGGAGTTVGPSLCNLFQSTIRGRWENDSEHIQRAWRATVSGFPHLAAPRCRVGGRTL